MWAVAARRHPERRQARRRLDHRLPDHRSVRAVDGDGDRRQRHRRRRVGQRLATGLPDRPRRGRFVVDAEHRRRSPDDPERVVRAPRRWRQGERAHDLRDAPAARRRRLLHAGRSGHRWSIRAGDARPLARYAFRHRLDASGDRPSADPADHAGSHDPDADADDADDTGSVEAGQPGDTKNCPDFATQAAAQQWFDTYYPWYGDVAKLDQDNDGEACESLPFRFAANVPAATVVSLQVAGRGGVPPTGVSAVVLSVTAVDPEADGWVQVAPTPVQIGASSTLNVTRGRTIANLAVVPLGAGGQVDLYATARADLLADVVGYFTNSSASSSTSGLFVPIVPDRRFDSRALSSQPLAAGSVSRVETAAIAPGASAIAGNLTANQAAAGGWAQLAPAPIHVGAASNLNTAYNGQTIASAAVSPVGAGGGVELYTLLSAHLLLDVTGWFTGS